LADDERQAFVEAFERALAEIPTVRGVRIGRRVRHGAGYESAAPDVDYLAAIEFDSLDGLHTYLTHPAHDDLGRCFRIVASEAIVYDFEVGGMEMLRIGN
jgi:hypothetical protein